MVDVFLATINRIWRELFLTKSKDAELADQLVDLQIKYLEKKNDPSRK